MAFRKRLRRYPAKGNIIDVKDDNVGAAAPPNVSAYGPGGGGAGIADGTAAQSHGPGEDGAGSADGEAAPPSSVLSKFEIPGLPSCHCLVVNQVGDKCVIAVPCAAVAGKVTGRAVTPTYIINKPRPVTGASERDPNQACESNGMVRVSVIVVHEHVHKNHVSAASSNDEVDFPFLDIEDKRRQPCAAFLHKAVAPVLARIRRYDVARGVAPEEPQPGECQEENQRESANVEEYKVSILLTYVGKQR